jgi:fructose-bisphosphate aldolase, class II
VARLRAADVVLWAYRAGVAIPAFNVPYLAMIEPVVQAVVDQDSVALVETARVEWYEFGSESPERVMQEFRRWGDPDHVWMHLDHVPAVDQDGSPIDYFPVIGRAIGVGYQSVMIDGSRLPLEENIEATRRIADLAHAADVACEGELGWILGHEHGTAPTYAELFDTKKGFTPVEQAARFVSETGVDWLSVAVGSIHGAVSELFRDQTKIEARLDLDHLAEIRRRTSVPLVLHGGSGVRRADVLAGAKQGIAKVNVATEIRQAYERALKGTGRVPAAQDAAYSRTSELVRDYFGNTGLRERLSSSSPNGGDT